LLLRSNCTYSHNDESGATTVEAIFLIAFFALLFFGGVDIGRAVMIKHSMDIGVYRAARYLSISPLNEPIAEQMIRDEVDNNLLGGHYGSSVRILIDIPATTYGTAFQITADLDYHPTVPLLPLPIHTLHVQHTQMIEHFP